MSDETDAVALYPNQLVVNAQGNVHASINNAFSLGTAETRWSGIWTETHPITSADAAQMTNIQDCHLSTTFIRAIRPVSYQFVVGGNSVTIDDDGTAIVDRPGQRTHCGFVAQQVKSSLGDQDFGGWISTDPSNPNAIQALRYEQLIAPLVKALQEALDRIDALEAAINA